MAEHQPQVIDLRERRDGQLLRHVYTDLYVPNFPFAEEREDFATLERLLWGERTESDPVTHFLVAGPHLNGDRPDVTGIAVSEYYAGSSAGLLSYIAVASGVRHDGLGRLLLAETRRALARDAQATGERLAAIFAEIHDPARMSDQGDVMDPQARVAAMARLGARRIPIPYVQPELTPGRGRSTNLMLVAFSGGDDPLESLPCDVVVDFLRGLYRALGVPAPDDDEDFVRAVGTLTGETVELTELA